jgi:hypothetical protein
MNKCPTCGKTGYWPDPVNATEFPDYDLINHRWIPQSEWTPEIAQAVARHQQAVIASREHGAKSGRENP